MLVKSGKANSWLFKNSDLSQLVVMKYSVDSKAFLHWFWRLVPFKISISFGESIITFNYRNTILNSIIKGRSL